MLALLFELAAGQGARLIFSVDEKISCPLELLPALLCQGVHQARRHSAATTVKGKLR
jgi:hypothetical protein